jgi:hypothetical protein
MLAAAATHARGGPKALPQARGVRAVWEQGRACGCAKTAATCRELLAVEESLWTFVRVERVEPASNHIEWRQYGWPMSGSPAFDPNLVEPTSNSRGIRSGA